MLKDVKFPEVENVSKMPSSCPKVSTCLQKRVNGLDDIVKKFDASETALNETQKTFPNLNSCVVKQDMLFFDFYSCKLWASTIPRRSYQTFQ